MEVIRGEVQDMITASANYIYYPHPILRATRVVSLVNHHVMAVVTPSGTEGDRGRQHDD